MWGMWSSERGWKSALGYYAVAILLWPLFGPCLQNILKKCKWPFLELGSILREEGACIGVWYGGNTNLGSREAGAPLPPSLRGSIGTGRPGLEWPPIPNAPPPSSHIWAPPKLITFFSSFDGFILNHRLLGFPMGVQLKFNFLGEHFQSGILRSDMLCGFMN